MAVEQVVSVKHAKRPRGGQDEGQPLVTQRTP